MSVRESVRVRESVCERERDSDISHTERERGREGVSQISVLPHTSIVSCPGESERGRE